MVASNSLLSHLEDRIFSTSSWFIHRKLTNGVEPKFYSDWKQVFAKNVLMTCLHSMQHLS